MGNSPVISMLWKACLGFAVAASLAAGRALAFPVSVTVDAAKTNGEFKPIWRFFGADEPNYAYMKDGRKLLGELGELRPGDVFFRTHNLLCSGDGTPALKWGSTNVYTEDEKGNPIYDWTVVDRIFDTYVKAGVHPYAQVGFMPEALSSHPQPYQHEWRPGLKYDLIETGWAYPPKDWVKWQELAYQWAKHCVVRYGMAECEKWYWEVWNEANGAYWKGTHAEFCRLHDLAVDSIRRAIPKARVGGPDSAGSGGKFTEDFLQHCLHEKNYATGEVGTPLDFISFHAKGSPKFVDGHVRMGISEQFKAMESAYRIFAKHPELAGKPIIIGESDPDGCAACQGKALGYRNTTLYASYTAASFSREQELAEKHSANLEGALTWAFEFEDQPFFAGQRVMANNGIDLPVLNVFRMYAKMGSQRLATTSSNQTPLEEIVAKGVRGEPDVGAVATKGEDGAVAVMVWHYHEDDVPGPSADVTVELTGLTSAKVKVTRFAVDEAHSNAFAAWQRMGSPNPPNDKQYAELVAAGKLEAAGEAVEMAAEGGKVKVSFPLSRQGVALVVAVPVK
jgi:xylan 1,4-beta-xylosidase